MTCLCNLSLTTRLMTMTMICTSHTLTGLVVGAQTGTTLTTWYMCSATCAASMAI